MVFQAIWEAVVKLVLECIVAPSNLKSEGVEVYQVVGEASIVCHGEMVDFSLCCTNRVSWSEMHLQLSGELIPVISPQQNQTQVGLHDSIFEPFQGRLLEVTYCKKYLCLIHCILQLL